MNIILYTNNCPKCKILKLKLDQKNIKYEICDDLNVMVNKKFKSMPILEVNNKYLTFLDAINFVNNQ